jgi:ligand-binding sensor domain-containing protein
MARVARLFFLVLVIVAGASSQGALWNEFNGVAGFSAIREGAGGILFGSRGDGVLYSSTDRGQSWRGATVFGGTMVSLYARGANLIVGRFDTRAANFYQIHISRDNGATWTRVTTSNNTGRQMMGFDDSSHAFGYFRDSFFGTPAGPYFLVKYDGAGAWPIVGNQLPNAASVAPNVVSAHAIDHTGAILIGASRAGLFVTRDQGVTWETQFAGRGISALSVTPDNHIYLAADPTVADGGIYVSSDGAVSWNYLGFADKRVAALCADSSGNVIASTADGFYRLSAGSDTWDYASPFSELFEIMVATGGNTVLASSGTWGQFRSLDGGDTWVQSGPRKRDVYAILVTSSGTTIAGTLGARTFASTDEGANWSQAPEGAICDNVVALAEAGGAVLAGTECGLYRSVDEGVTWARDAEVLLDGPVSSLAVNPFDGAVYAGTYFGVARSTDAGLSWSPAGLGTDHVTGLAVGPSGKLFALTAATGVHVSSDNGATWTGRGLVRDDLQSLHVDAAGTVLVGLFGGVARSTDDGASWSTTSFAASYIAGITSLGAQSVYAASANGIYRSSDEGSTWTILDGSGLAYPHVIALSFDNRGVLFAGTYNGGVFRTGRTLSGVQAEPALPSAYGLKQNYPNPFNPATIIEYTVPAGAPAEVRVTVYDLLGREVASLASGPSTPGVHRVRWDAGAAPGGVYFVRMTSRAGLETRKMLLLR